MLPWDWDIDTQVSGETLLDMGERYNMTYYEYSSTTPGHDRPWTAPYLLDVNPHSTERDNGAGFNIIDARWINIENGLFIDITGISALNPDKDPDLLSCKNFHDYRRKDIWPLRESDFEGIKAQVPRKYAKLLMDEYGVKALELQRYEG